VVPRKRIKIELENAETLKAIKLLAINEGVQYNELIEEGMKMVLEKYGKLSDLRELKPSRVRRSLSSQP
jgi:hypothetical protein